jgi:glutamyl-tRNA synthetase
MKNSAVRVRFAPSPTGFLHIGGVRTALFNYLYAKKHGGKFILRLEDTDRERFVEEGVEQIVEVLKWLGLEPDEGYWEGAHSGEYGPYIQSERLPNYQQFADQLIEQGLAYRSYITPDDFTQQRQAAIAAKQPFVYRRSMEPSDASSSNAPIRLDIDTLTQKLGSQNVTWNDEVRGEFSVESAIIDDFILIKADGFPTYNFANVIDDHLMKISHILRGDEFISSTPKHALLYDALGFARPRWAHLPVILGADGAKLSKRHGDTDALQYRDKGYLPDALLNFLALLGWNDGTEQEIFSRDELIDAFSLERIQKSPAKFDLERLNWMNGLFIREKLSQAEYLDLAKAAITGANLPWNAAAEAGALLERDRIKTLTELPLVVDFFVQPPLVNETMITLLTSKKPAEVVAQLLAAAQHGMKEFSQVLAYLT